MDNQIKQVFVVAGGSGGHVYPAVAYIEELISKDDIRVVFWFDSHTPDVLEGLTREKVIALQIPCIKFQGLKSCLSYNFWESFIKLFLNARRLFKSDKPSWVVGFGNFTSLPIVVAALSKRIPTLIHEQNMSFGKVNQFLLPHVKKVGLSMLKDEVKSKKFVYTGFPVRKTLKNFDKKEAMQVLGLDPNKRTLLIFGGSQGAESINTTFESFMGLHRDQFESTWQWLHLTGSHHDRRWNRKQTPKDISYLRYRYSDDMGLFYSAADLVLSRAGASTLHELAQFRKDAIVIPYPYARGHQIRNVEHLKDHRNIQIILDGDFNDKTLLKCFLAYINKDFETKEKEPYYNSLKLDGASELVKITG